MIFLASYACALNFLLSFLQMRRMIVFPELALWGRDPIVVALIDVTSSSASELFAACLQASGRAVVVGDRSPGSVMESDNMIFQNGAILMYPVAQLSTPDGPVLEGHGAIPDIEVGLKREMLFKGIDSQLDAALRQIKKEMKKKI